MIIIVIILIIIIISSFLYVLSYIYDQFLL